MILAVAICWILYSCLEGARDGYFYHYRNTTSEPKNENIHWIYMVIRAFILSIITIFHYNIRDSYLSTGTYIVGLGLVFSFFHNGMYYHTRKRLSDGKIYPMGWISSSTTSQATLEFNWSARVYLAVTGLTGIIASFTINI